MDVKELIGKRVYAYIRISREVQDAERQRATIRDWAASHGLVIAEWYEDTEGSNPRDQADDRINFQRLVKLVESGIVDAVVVDAQDRFGTFGTWELGKYLDILISNDCSLWTVEDGCLTQDDDGTVIKAVVNAQTSLKEQREKGWRALNKKLEDAKAGRYPGGYPPYGIDVVCIGLDGSHKWRVVWIGDHERLKIDANGQETIYKGKNNMPARDEYDIPKYAPTIRTDRLEVVRNIFMWYASEEISPTQIATRLNTSGVSAVFGVGWNKEKVKNLLKNPVYIGFPAYNKRARSRFWEFRDGKKQQVKRTKGKAKAGRTRSKEDHIVPDKPLFDPIVPVKLFEEVQRKLKKSSEDYQSKVPKARSPRTASFWLRNILVCSGCMKPMRAWNANQDRPTPYRSYFCSTYGTYGKENPTGCRSNRVKAELLEKMVDLYLEETHKQIVELINSKSESDLAALDHLDSSVKLQHEELRRLWKQRNRYIRKVEEVEGDIELKVISATYGPDDIDEDGFIPVLTSDRVYEYLFNERKPVLEKELKKLDAEHSDLLERSLRLPAEAEIAHQKVRDRLLKIEGRIKELQGDLRYLNDDIAQVVVELKRRMVAIEEAREAIGGDSDFRRKAQLVKQVIDQIVCYFRDTNGKGNQPRTEVVKVEIIPQEGEKRTCYPNGRSPGLNLSPRDQPDDRSRN